MLIHITKKLSDSWKVPLVDTVPEDISDTWNITYGNFKHKRYYILAHEPTMWSMLFFELTPKNFESKVDDKLKIWSNYYGFPDLSTCGIFNTSEQIFCPNKDRSITGMMSQFKGDLWYQFSNSDSLFEIELKMHEWVFLPLKGNPIKIFTEFVKGKNR
jgi:hypothetical protein